MIYRILLAAAVATILAADITNSNALSLLPRGLKSGIQEIELLNVARYASRHHRSTSSRSAMLARSQLGNAARSSRAGVNRGRQKRVITQRSRCNDGSCTVPSPPGTPIPIPYPNSGATSR